MTVWYPRQGGGSASGPDPWEGTRSEGMGSYLAARKELPDFERADMRSTRIGRIQRPASLRGVRTFDIDIPDGSGTPQPRVRDLPTEPTEPPGVVDQALAALTGPSRFLPVPAAAVVGVAAIAAFYLLPAKFAWLGAAAAAGAALYAEASP